MESLLLRDANADVATCEKPPVQQTVVVHFLYGQEDLRPLFALVDKLDAAVKGSGLGIYAGHEIAVDRSDGYLYLYGPDADALLRAIMPILNATPFAHGAKVKLRYGPPTSGTRESTTTL